MTDSSVTVANGARKEFTYDGLGRRIKIVEKDSSNTITSNRDFIWDGLAIAEMRENGTDTNYYSQGFEWDEKDRYYTFDLFGSIREIVKDDETSLRASVVSRHFNVLGAKSNVLYWPSRIFGNRSFVHLSFYHW